MKKIVAISALCIFWCSCTREPLKKRQDAMRPVTMPPVLSDDLPLEPLVAGIKREIEILRKKPAEHGMIFGNRVVLATEYAAALEELVRLAESSGDREGFFNFLKSRFDFHAVYGTGDWGKALITSYYEPELRGARRKSTAFTQPLYRTPNDLVEVVFPRSDERFADTGQMRGRVAPQKTVRGTPRLVPYYTREEIDSSGALAKRGLELCWVDPVDAFFLHIQGSGTVILQEGGELRVGYADQNGHPYQAIGRFLTDIIPLEQITLQTLEGHLRGLPADNSRALLNRNPSYIFFEKREGEALTAGGTPVISGRTIATDARFFPKGALAFLKFEKPVFASASDREPVKWEPVGRLVLDQDTGGAIKGGGRVDLFWGYGAAGKQHAGVIKQTGEIYYLVPRARQ